MEDIIVVFQIRLRGFAIKRKFTAQRHDWDGDWADKPWFLTGIRHREALFFRLFSFFLFFLLTVRTLKNETPVHDRVTPENTRSEVIRTTCSARQRLTPAFASSADKSAAFKNEQNFVYAELYVKKRKSISQYPRGRRAASIKASAH